MGRLITYGFIYKITNIKNNKVYIGQTTRSRGFDDRYPFKGDGIERVYNFYDAQKRYGAEYNVHLFNSMNKYGFDNFDVDKEFDCANSKEELDEKEQFWIKHFNSTDKKYGYNKLIGGSGFKYGKESYIEKIGKTRNPILCLETNDIFLTIKDAEKEYGICDTTIRKVCTGDFKSAYSKIYKKRLNFKYLDIEKKTKQPIICITTNEIFKNIKEASEKYAIHESNLYKNCVGKTMSSGRHPETNEKLIWSFLFEYKLSNL